MSEDVHFVRLELGGKYAHGAKKCDSERIVESI